MKIYISVCVCVRVYIHVFVFSLLCSVFIFPLVLPVILWSKCGFSSLLLFLSGSVSFVLCARDSFPFPSFSPFYSIFDCREDLCPLVAIAVADYPSIPAVPAVAGGGDVVGVGRAVDLAGFWSCLEMRKKKKMLMLMMLMMDEGVEL